MPPRQDPLPYEQHIQTFLARTGTDLDAQAAVFNLDHAAMDVIATMEGLALRRHGLTHAGFVVLMTIWISGPRETRELAAVLRVTRGAIVGSVNTLEKKGRRDRPASSQSSSLSDSAFHAQFTAGTTSIEAADESGWVVSVTPSGG